VLSSPAVAIDASYNRRLLFFLSVASFFEGYDLIAMSQLLPNIRAHYGLSPTEGGLMVGVVNVGTMIAYVLVRKADRWGRKSVLSITILGYAIASFLSGLAPSAWTFALAQLLARIFLIGEWAIALVVAAEEFPAHRRGSAMGIIQASASLGSIACAALVPLLLKIDLFGMGGWRTVYFVGAVPLLLLAFARRSMRETRRFETASKTADAGLFSILRGPYARRVALVALVWALCYMCTQNAVTFWKEFAQSERGYSDATVGKSVAIAAILSLPLVFFSGRMLDVIGRRKSAVIIFIATSGGCAAAYTLTGSLALKAALTVAIFGATAILQVLNAYTAELFPTEKRADAFAWTNNLLGRVGYVLSPMAVGLAAERIGWGVAVSATAIFPLIALALVMKYFPETRGKELEETAK
jgi:putative MFS transporter